MMQERMGFSISVGAATDAGRGFSARAYLALSDTDSRVGRAYKSQ